MWPFKEKVVLRKVQVPGSHIVEVLEALDKMRDSKSTLDRYNFWMLAEHVCPELVAVGTWSIDTKSATQPYFQEE